MADIETEGYPELGPSFKEPILSDFKRKSGCQISLLSRNEIVSLNSVTGDYGEFVVSMASSAEQRIVFIVGSERSPLGDTMKQWLLAMKDTRGSDGGSKQRIVGRCSDTILH